MRSITGENRSNQNSGTHENLKKENPSNEKGKFHRCQLANPHYVGNVYTP
jgi:hypothetical protein